MTDDVLELCRISSGLYLACHAVRASGLHVSWYGGSDEGNVEASLMYPTVQPVSDDTDSADTVDTADEGQVAASGEDAELPQQPWRFLSTDVLEGVFSVDNPDTTLESLENQLHAWFDQRFSELGWSGDGDGTDYGINIQFDFVKNVVTYDEWQTEQVTTSDGEVPLELSDTK